MKKSEASNFFKSQDIRVFDRKNQEKKICGSKRRSCGSSKFHNRFFSLDFLSFR